MRPTHAPLSAEERARFTLRAAASACRGGTTALSTGDRTVPAGAAELRRRRRRCSRKARHDLLRKRFGEADSSADGIRPKESGSKLARSIADALKDPSQVR